MNLQVQENVDKAIGLMKRAKAAGYNGVVLADYKLNILDRVPDFYFDHARTSLQAAKELQLEVIPCVAPMGYSDGLLAHDPNLAEGIPVVDTPMIVADGSARIASSNKSLLPGGRFEEHRNHTVGGWSFQDGADELSFVDNQVKHAGNSSLRWEKPASIEVANARVSRVVAVKPWRQFHASVWMKTADYSAANEVRLFAMGKDGRVLSHSNLGVQQDQDWTEHHVIFNTLDNDEIRIYCGTWGIDAGKLWMDDLTLQETAFVNLLRRDGCPFVVRDAAGTVYEEGVDFAPLHDPKLGQVPWPGNYDVYHDPPALRILPQSRLRNGTQLLVSFSHTVTVYDNQVTCCLDHPKVFQILQQQIEAVERLFQPKTYFLSHDEIRVANWCSSCKKEGRPAGSLLATNMQKCISVIRKVNPSANLCVWSDMFDPHHNATNNFYLVNGDLAGSWQGLPRDMIIVNWNHGHADKSLPFFANRGHQQVLSGYYDGEPRAIRGWLDTGAPLPGIQGAMYTTWRNDYRHLETFAQAAWGNQ